MDRPIFLIGFMGSGKTTWGKKLANRLQKQFIDLDQLIVKQIEMSIPEYFERFGEAQFRILESKILKEQLSPNTIVSTGGGSPCYFDNMDWINKNGLSIYLCLSPKALFTRLQQSNIASRPALKALQGEELLAFIEDKLAARADYYNQAMIHVDQLNATVDSIIKQINEYAA